jgi:hypothetical protein
MRFWPGLVAQPDRCIIHRNEGLIQVMRSRLKGAAQSAGGNRRTHYLRRVRLVDGDRAIRETGPHRRALRGPPFGPRLRGRSCPKPRSSRSGESWCGIAGSANSFGIILVSSRASTSYSY